MANTDQLVKGEGDSGCFLCPDRGSAVMDGDLRGHLTYEHGIMFNMDFFVSVGDYMRTHPSFPIAPFILDTSGSVSSTVDTAMGEDGAPLLSGYRCVCSLCGYETGNDTTFWTHITKKHKVNYKDYITEHGHSQVPITNGIFHCEICKRPIKHLPNNVLKHLKSKHSITLWEEYKDLVLQGVDSEINEQTSESFTEHEEDPLNESGLSHIQSLNSEIFVKEEFKHAEDLKNPNSISRSSSPTSLCSKRLLADLLNNSEHPVGSSKRNKPTNLKDKKNTYCDLCEEEFLSRTAFLTHCSAAHDIKFKGKSGGLINFPGGSEEPQPAPPAAVEAGPALLESVPRSHSPVDKPRLSSPDKVTCRYCGSSFHNVSNMERHVREVCKEITDEEKMRRDDLEASFHCAGCNRRYKKKGNWVKHVCSAAEK